MVVQIRITYQCHGCPKYLDIRCLYPSDTAYAWLNILGKQEMCPDCQIVYGELEKVEW